MLDLNKAELLNKDIAKARVKIKAEKIKNQFNYGINYYYWNHWNDTQRRYIQTVRKEVKTKINLLVAENSGSNLTLRTIYGN